MDKRTIQSLLYVALYHQAVKVAKYINDTVTQSKVLDMEEALRKLGIDFPDAIKETLLNDEEPMDEFNIKEFVDVILSHQQKVNKRTFNKIKKSRKRSAQVRSFDCKPGQLAQLAMSPPTDENEYRSVTMLTPENLDMCLDFKSAPKAIHIRTRSRVQSQHIKNF